MSISGQQESAGENMNGDIEHSTEDKIGEWGDDKEVGEQRGVSQSTVEASCAMKTSKG